MTVRTKHGSSGQHGSAALGHEPGRFTKGGNFVLSSPWALASCSFGGRFASDRSASSRCAFRQVGAGQVGAVPVRKDGFGCGCTGSVLRKDRNRPLLLAEALTLRAQGGRLLVNEQTHRAAVQMHAPGLMDDDGKVEHPVVIDGDAVNVGVGQRRENDRLGGGAGGTDDRPVVLAQDLEPDCEDNRRGAPLARLTRPRRQRRPTFPQSIPRGHRRMSRSCR